VAEDCHNPARCFDLQTCCSYRGDDFAGVVGIVIHKADAIALAPQLKSTACALEGCDRFCNYPKIYTQFAPYSYRRQSIAQIVRP
jgi:hypothetical protein